MRETRRRWLVAIIVVAIVVLVVLAERALAPKLFPAPAWVDTVGPVALSSPTTGVIDGVPVVAFGSENGELYVVDARTGKDLPGWPRPVDIAGRSPTAVESSPTIAYLDGPSGPPTIVVGAGSTYVADQQGGLIAFNANGSVRFVFHTKDVFDEWHPGAVDGYDNGVVSTPAIGDVTGDGQQDIVFGSWDHRLYALTPSGTLVKGFPVDNEDTIWSSPRSRTCGARATSTTSSSAATHRAGTAATAGSSATTATATAPRTSCGSAARTRRSGPRRRWA